MLDRHCHTSWPPRRVRTEKAADVDSFVTYRVFTGALHDISHALAAVRKQLYKQKHLREALGLCLSDSVRPSARAVTSMWHYDVLRSSLGCDWSQTCYGACHSVVLMKGKWCVGVCRVTVLKGVKSNGCLEDRQKQISLPLKLYTHCFVLFSFSNKL